MSVKERLGMFIKSKGLSVNRFEKTCGLSTGYVGNMRVSIQPDKIKSIAHSFPELNTGWLLTGEGEMLRDSEICAVINYEGKGVPYYDVDFIGGFDLIENDQTINPEYYINFPQYNKADMWVNVTGHSMSPEVRHGDMIAIQTLNGWPTHLMYGEMYALVTDENRTIKYVRRSKKGDDFLRLVPVNTDEFDEQDIPISIVRHIYKVLGCAKRFQ